MKKDLINYIFLAEGKVLKTVPCKTPQDAYILAEIEAERYNKTVSVQTDILYTSEGNNKDTHEILPTVKHCSRSLGFEYSRGACTGTGTGFEIYKRALAYEQLLIVCTAWNKKDKFTPDWSNTRQSKWTFVKSYDEDRLVLTIERTKEPQPFVFKTEKRVAHFINKYKDNILLAEGINNKIELCKRKTKRQRLMTWIRTL